MQPPPPPPPLPPPPAAVACPQCGSANVFTFSDGSGRCNACQHAFRGVGHLESGAADVAGLAKDAETGKGSAPEVSPFRNTNLLVGALGGLGGVVLILSVPVGLVIRASRIPGSNFDAEIAKIFNAGALAIAFCALTVIAVALGVYAIYVAYRHSVGPIPYGGALLALGIGGLIVAGLLVPVSGASVLAVAAAGSVLVLLGGVVDLRAG